MQRATKRSERLRGIFPTGPRVGKKIAAVPTTKYTNHTNKQHSFIKQSAKSRNFHLKAYPFTFSLVHGFTKIPLSSPFVYFVFFVVSLPPPHPFLVDCAVLRFQTASQACRPTLLLKPRG
jgi:hypothetical protein